MNMRKALEQLRAGAITFRQFEAATAKDWTKLAGMLFLAWKQKLPAGIELDDIRQEMLCEAWRVTREFDPLRNVSIESFVVFNACAKARKWIHKQRNAKRRDDKAPSRVPIPFVAFEREDCDTEIVDRLAFDTTEFEELVDRARRFDSATKCATGIDLYALAALRMEHGDIRKASELLFSEKKLALKLRWVAQTCAARQIEKSVVTLCG